jgi:hypothetical protein
MAFIGCYSPERTCDGNEVDGFEQKLTKETKKKMKWLPNNVWRAGGTGM